MDFGREYVITFNGVTFSAAQDFFEVTPASNKPIWIKGIFIGQYSDFGDAQDELLGLTVVRGYTTSGSGGSSFTPLLNNKSDPAASFSSEINNTTVANTGTAEILHSDSWNVRAGVQLILPPKRYFYCTSTETRIVVRSTAPADALTLNGSLWVEEA